MEGTALLHTTLGDVCMGDAVARARPRTFNAGSDGAGCATERSDRTVRDSAVHRRLRLFTAQEVEDDSHDHCPNDCHGTD